MSTIVLKIETPFLTSKARSVFFSPFFFFVVSYRDFLWWKQNQQEIRGK
jgi:hypothetical protein